MSSVNKAIIVGRLGRDPELRHTQTGTAVASFSVATEEKVKDTKRTEWHQITAWGKTAELCAQYLAKGSQVYVEGRIQSEEYVDKTGAKRTTTKIVASEVKFLGGGPRSETPAAPNHDDADIPF
jgi:single-strand DNA-binding protein